LKNKLKNEEFMRISAKGRYALAAMIHIAQNSVSEECITVISIADKLGISKIYLEQVFSLLKRGGLVTSIKGAQGGYQLSRMPRLITALDVLSAVEHSLFEKIEVTVKDKAPDIEAVMLRSVFNELDESIRSTLQKVTLEYLMNEAAKLKKGQGYMYYI
jgi:Rrf2 family protein